MEYLSGHMAICGYCRNRVPIEMIFIHLREIHDVTPEIECWPDGNPVVIDHTLQPEDFQR